MIKCIICSSARLSKFIKKGDFISVSSDGSKLFKSQNTFLCKKCNFFFKELNNSYKLKIKNLYGSYKLYKKTLGETKLFSIYFNKLLTRTDILSKLIIDEKFLKPNQKLLDYGCGNGNFLEKISKTKANNLFYGLEIENRNLRKLEYHRKIKKIFIKNIDKIDSKFDFITMIHVLEHVENLNKEIKKIHSLLKENGKLLIQVPNLSENFLDFITFDHIYHFNDLNIINIMKNHDFILFKKLKLINKEITLIFQKKEIKNNVRNIYKKKVYNTYNKNFKDFIKYLNRFVAHNEIKGIFGAGQKSIFLINNLKNKNQIEFFTDEDKNKINKLFLNKMVFYPTKLKNRPNVLLFDTKKIFNLAKRKYPNIKFIHLDCSLKFFAKLNVQK